MEDVLSDHEFVFAIERDINALLERLSATWTKDEIASVREDLGYGEWDIAVEQIAGVIVNLKKPLRSDVLLVLSDLEYRLNLQNSELMQALHARAIEIGVEPIEG